MISVLNPDQKSEPKESSIKNDMLKPKQASTSRSGLFMVQEKDGSMNCKLFDDIEVTDSICLGSVSKESEQSSGQTNFNTETNISFKNAMKSEDKSKWDAAIQEELESLNSHQTWGDPVELPYGERATPTKLI